MQEVRNSNVQNIVEYGKERVGCTRTCESSGKGELNVPRLEGQLKGREVNAHEQFGQVKR